MQKSVIARRVRYPSRLNLLTSSILFAFVLFRRHNAIFDSVGMKHSRGEIEQEKAEPPAGRGECSKENKNAHRDRANHPEKTGKDVSLVDVSQARNDTEHHCDKVAGFAFRGFRRAADPIAAVAAFRVFRQKMPAIRAWHLITGR